MGETVRIQLCGEVTIEVAGRRVEAGLPGRQGRLLFAYLLLERQRGATRDELAALLWPGGPPPSAGLTLRALLSKMRAALGSKTVVGADVVRVEFGEAQWIDVEAARDAVRTADEALADRSWQVASDFARKAAAISGRPFLPGDTSEWSELKRRELEDVHLGALELRARASIEIGGPELAVAEDCARAVVTAAPYREAGHLALMRVLSARGNRAEALTAYERARVLLRDELGIVPMAELRSLHERLLRDEPADEPIPVVGDSPAVLTGGAPASTSCIERCTANAGSRESRRSRAS
jgi:SARP family transcriptional regulator, regulator of embCAB operon